jgi:hypothetical protein
MVCLTAGWFFQRKRLTLPDRIASDIQLLDNVADKYLDNCVTALSRDFFNRQEQALSRGVGRISTTQSKP